MNDANPRCGHVQAVRSLASGEGRDGDDQVGRGGGVPRLFGEAGAELGRRILTRHDEQVVEGGHRSLGRCAAAAGAGSGRGRVRRRESARTRSTRRALRYCRENHEARPETGAAGSRDETPARGAVPASARSAAGSRCLRRKVRIRDYRWRRGRSAIRHSIEAVASRVELVLAQLAIEGRAADAEERGGGGPVAAGVAQGAAMIACRSSSASGTIPPA